MWGDAWGDVGRCGTRPPHVEIYWGGVGRDAEMWGDVWRYMGRYGEMWGDMRRCGEMCGDVVWRDVGRDFLIRRRDGAAAGTHQQWLLVCNAWAQVAQLLAEPLAISLYDKDASRLDRDDSLGKATLPGHFLDTS